MDSMSKICTGCKRDKPYSEYCRASKNKNGRAAQCKECDKKYYQEHQEEILMKRRMYWKKNHDEILLKQRQYYQDHAEEERDKAKTRRCTFREKTQEQARQSYRKHHIKNRLRRQQYYQNHREEIIEKEYQRRHKYKHTLSYIEWITAYQYKNKAILKKRRQQYYIHNKSYIRQQQKEYLQKT